MPCKTCWASVVGSRDISMRNVIWYPPEGRSVFKGLSLEIFSNDLPACLLGLEMWSGTNLVLFFHPGWAELCASGRGICMTPPTPNLPLAWWKIKSETPASRVQTSVILEEYPWHTPHLRPWFDPFLQKKQAWRLHQSRRGNWGRFPPLFTQTISLLFNRFAVYWLLPQYPLFSLLCLSCIFLIYLYCFLVQWASVMQWD